MVMVTVVVTMVVDDDSMVSCIESVKWQKDRFARISVLV